MSFRDAERTRSKQRWARLWTCSPTGLRLAVLRSGAREQSLRVSRPGVGVSSETLWRRENIRWIPAATKVPEAHARDSTFADSTLLLHVSRSISRSLVLQRCSPNCCAGFPGKSDCFGESLPSFFFVGRLHQLRQKHPWGFFEAVHRCILLLLRGLCEFIDQIRLRGKAWQRSMPNCSVTSSRNSPQS